MKSVLVDKGKEALAQAIATGRKLKVSNFHIGEAANFTPATTETDVKSTIVYSGDARLISTSVISGDQIRYTVTIPETAGPFSVGNIMLFFTDEDTGQLVPYLFGVEPIPQPKYKSDPPASIGNRLMFALIAKFTNIAEAFNVTVTSPELSSLPNIIDEYGLPPGQSASFQQMIGQNNTRTGRPFLAMRRELDNAWFISPFSQRLDDPDFGAIKGGVAGDKYIPFYGNYYSGGIYPMPPAAFNNYLDGGPNWSIPSDIDLPIDGGDY